MRRKSRAVCLVGLAVTWGLAGLAAASPPVLVSQGEIEQIAHDPARWNALKGRCDANLDKVIGSGYSDAYAGWDWRDAAADYATCYQVATFLQLDPAVVSSYSRKALAVMKTMARHHWYRSVNGALQPEGTVEYIALGDGSRTTFVLPRPPAPAPALKAYLVPATELALTYNGPRATLPTAFCPILKISNTTGGPANYARELDYHLSWYNTLKWVGANHPAPGAPYYVTVANGSLQAAANVSVAGGILTFTSPPAANRAVAVQYLGPDYEQTGNFMGGVEGMKPDALYMARTVNVGLAYAYDLLRESPDLTPALREEFVGVLNAQSDYYEDYLTYDPTDPDDEYGGPEGSGLGNYSIRGHLTAIVFTAYATTGDNPRTAEMKARARSTMTKTYDALQKYVPGGFGAEGSYNDGSDADLLHLFDVWKRVEQQDLAAALRWTSNLVPAIIQGTKPDLTFYDGGDWHSLPARPHVSSLQAFAKYQADHPQAPFARQLLAELGQPVPPGPRADYRIFPPAHVTQGTGALYARSDWEPDAVWLSLAVGPMFLVGHQHFDRGHFTLQRGEDYLLINGGQFGGGARGTVPFHNSLGFDDRGAGNLIVYPNPPSQGAWEDFAQSRPPRFLSRSTFVYAQEDLTPSYANTNPSLNAVKRAVRTLVFIRPDVVVMHDQAQTFNAATKKFFNINFAGAVSREGDVFSAVTGQSRVFMRSLVPANPSPTITLKGTPMESDPDNTSYPIRGDNYQVVLPTGQTDSTFLHLVQAAPAGQAQMVPSSYLRSTDGRAQGVQVDMGDRRWTVLNAVRDTELGGALAYGLPRPCPCVHVIGDLPSGQRYSVKVTAAGGALIAQSQHAAGRQGVLFFTTWNADAAQVELAPLPRGPVPARPSGRGTR